MVSEDPVIGFLKWCCIMGCAVVVLIVIKHEYVEYNRRWCVIYDIGNEIL